MNIETSTLEMNQLRTTRQRAFTIMELLLVIAIMAVVAGLIVALAGVTGESKKVNRTKAELEALVLLVESYKAKVGVYPPDNPNDVTRHSLLYELASAVRTNAPDPIYATPFPIIPPIQGSELLGTFNVNGVVNARDHGSNDPDDNRAHPILKNLTPSQIKNIGGNAFALVVAVDGPTAGPNTWRYAVGTNATHNRESFDLWAEIVVSSDKTNIIGNWKN